MIVRGARGLVHRAREGWRAARTTPRFVASRQRWAARRLVAPFVLVPITVRGRSGERYRLSRDPIDDRVLTELHGRFHPLYFPVAAEAVPPGALIVDVGAHHGFWAVAALARWPAARIVAVEPDPEGAALLRDNLAINGYLERAEVVEGAIAAREGTEVLARAPDGSWGNALAGDAGSAGPRVRTFRLETILRGRRPYLVKCNAEGGEFALVPQLFELGLAPDWLILFLHPEAGPIDALLAAVRSHGYEVAPVESDADHPRYVCRRAESAASRPTAGSTAEAVRPA